MGGSRYVEGKGGFLQLRIKSFEVSPGPKTNEGKNRANIFKHVFALFEALVW